MGWPEEEDFINYKIVVFDPQYLPDYCGLQDQWSLSENYEYACKTSTSDLSWFYGFKRTRQVSIKGGFFDTQGGFFFEVENTPAYYGVLGFPFKKTADFMDLRTHSTIL